MYVEVFVLCISDDQLQCWDNLTERLAWIEVEGVIHCQTRPM